MRRWMPVFVAFIMSVALLTVAACRPADGDPLSAGPRRSPTPDPCALPRRVVIGLDRSGSYAGREAAKATIDRIVHELACPGDEFFVRFIEANSYQPAAAVFSVRLPSIGDPPPTPENVYDRRRYNQAWSEWQTDLRLFGQAKLQVGDAVLNLSFGETPKTDVFGFFAKAAELLGATPPGYGKLILAFSDLADNVGNRVPLELQDATVYILAFEHDDPAEALALREEWRARLLDAGAARVEFRDPSDPDLPFNMASAPTLDPLPAPRLDERSQ